MNTFTDSPLGSPATCSRTFCPLGPLRIDRTHLFSTWFRLLQGLQAVIVNGIPPINTLPCLLSCPSSTSCGAGGPLRPRSEGRTVRTCAGLSRLVLAHAANNPLLWQGALPHLAPASSSAGCAALRPLGPLGPDRANLGAALFRLLLLTLATVHSFL